MKWIQHWGTINTTLFLSILVVGLLSVPFSLLPIGLLGILLVLFGLSLFCETLTTKNFQITNDSVTHGIVAITLGSGYALFFVIMGFNALTREFALRIPLSESEYSLVIMALMITYVVVLITVIASHPQKKK